MGSLDRFAQTLAAAVGGEGVSTPTETGSAVPPPVGGASTGIGVSGPDAQTRVPELGGAAPSQRGPERSRGGAESAAIAYEAAMLRRDPRGMARAAARLTGGAISEESIRALNARLGIEADDEMVSAVVRARR